VEEVRERNRRQNPPNFAIDGELVSPDPAPVADDNPLPPEVEEDDSQEFSKNALIFCEVRNRKAARARASDARQCPDAVCRFAIDTQ
jgi:hypothetical protein